MKSMQERFNEAYLKNVSQGLRKGQSIFNAVHEVDSETANELRATDIDCYYFDDRIDSFMTSVYTKWEGK